MRILSFFLGLAVIAGWATDGAAQGTATRWVHNGSQVSLSSAGARRQFHYQTPAADLVESGVQSGTLLFDGRRNSNQYAGTAYVFSKMCGALPYAVAGPVSPDERTVTMYGKAPIPNSSCRVIGYRDDVLVFYFSSPAEVVVSQKHAEEVISAQRGSEYDEFIQQWGSCFNGSLNPSAGIAGCDLALSFARINAADRDNLLERRATLVDWRAM